MIVPSIPGWVYLLVGLFSLLLGIAALALLRAFVTSFYDLVHPDRDGDWRRATVFGILVFAVVAFAVVMTSEGRAERAKVDSATSISTLEPKSFSTRITGSSCRLAYADGPPWEGNETQLLETIRADADAFEAEGWTVTRYRASDLRRGQLHFEYEPWSARATKGDADVLIGVDRTFRYTVVISGCESSREPDERFVTEIDRFPETPAPNSPATIAELDQTLSMAFAQVTTEATRPTDQVLVHGIDSPLDCFASSQSVRRSGNDQIETLERNLLAKGWTIHESPSPLIAVKDDRAVVASVSIDRGLTIVSYPPSCVDVNVDAD